MFNHGNFVKQRPFSPRVALALFLCFALGAGVVSCGGSSSDSRQRNATLVAGTKCKTAGQVKTISKQKVVCATLPSGKFWYAIAKEKPWVCIKLGGNRKQVGVFSVCGKNSKGKRRWFFTNILMPTPKGLQSTEPGAIEYVDKLNPTGDSIPLPDRPAQDARRRFAVHGGHSAYQKAPEVLLWGSLQSCTPSLVWIGFTNLQQV